MVRAAVKSKPNSSIIKACKMSAVQVLRRQHADNCVALVCSVVSLDVTVPTDKLLSNTRMDNRTALARQMVYYLAHTELRVSQKNLAKSFGRKRQTIRHGIALVEQKREDDREFDALIRSLSGLLFPGQNGRTLGGGY